MVENVRTREQPCTRCLISILDSGSNFAYVCACLCVCVCVCVCEYACVWVDV